MSKVGLNLVVSLSVGMMSVATPSMASAQTVNDSIQAGADNIKDFVTVIDTIVTDKMNAVSAVGSRVKGAVSGAATDTLDVTNEGLDMTADAALSAFNKFKQLNPVTYKGAIVAEYVYWLTVYGSLIGARKAGDLSAGALDLMGSASPEVKKTVSEATNRAVLWSPAVIVAYTELKKRFSRLGYVIPVTGTFLKDSGRVFDSFHTNGKLKLDVARIGKASGFWMYNTSKNVVFLGANYGFMLSWIFISRNDINLSFASLETIQAAELEVSQRLMDLRKEIPEVDKIDRKLAPYDESISAALRGMSKIE